MVYDFLWFLCLVEEYAYARQMELFGNSEAVVYHFRQICSFCKCILITSGVIIVHTGSFGVLCIWTCYPYRLLQIDVHSSDDSDDIDERIRIFVMKKDVDVTHYASSSGRCTNVYKL